MKFLKAALNKSWRWAAPRIGMGCKAQTTAIAPAMARICNAADRPLRGGSTRQGLVQRSLQATPRLIVLALAAPMAAVAPAQMSHTMQPGLTMSTADQALMTEGEIRKLDSDTGKLTIKHGPIRNLDMPAMTMVFSLKNRGFLDRVKVGDKVRFNVVMEAGKMVITDLRPAE